MNGIVTSVVQWGVPPKRTKLFMLRRRKTPTGIHFTHEEFAVLWATLSIIPNTSGRVLVLGVGDAALVLQAQTILETKAETL